MSFVTSKPNQCGVSKISVSDCNSISAKIKPRRKVAALFKMVQPALPDAMPPEAVEQAANPANAAPGEAPETISAAETVSS